MWGAPLSLAEAFPVVSHQSAVVPLVGCNVLLVLLPLSGRSTENLVWRVHASLGYCPEDNLATDVQGPDRKRPNAATDQERLVTIL